MITTLVHLQWSHVRVAVGPMVVWFPWCPSQAWGPPAGALRPHDESLLWIVKHLSQPWWWDIVALLSMIFKDVAHVCACFCVLVCESGCVLYSDVSLCGSWGKASDWGDPSSDANYNCKCLFELGRDVMMWKGHPSGTGLIGLWPCTVLVGLWVMSWVQMYQRDW